jgi:hypothetical protein
MERFGRGTLPPFTTPFKRPPPVIVVTRVAEPPPTTPAPTPAPEPKLDGEAPKSTCDLASSCPHCGTMMQPEHAHYRCLTCGYRDSCCF